MIQEPTLQKYSTCLMTRNQDTYQLLILLELPKVSDKLSLSKNYKSLLKEQTLIMMDSLMKNNFTTSCQDNCENDDLALCIILIVINI